MKINYNKRVVTIALTSLLLGFFVVLQGRSFGLLQDQNRDLRKNIFREIQILKTTNENLKVETDELTKTLQETSNQSSALKAIEDEINKYKILSGEEDIEGPGVVISIVTNVDPIWLVDLTNELFGAGAEAVSINDLRLTDATQGFEILPQGQIFLHVNTLETPYVFKTIGDPNALKNILLQSGGIYQRMKDKYPGLQMTVLTQENIKMTKI